MSDSKYFGTTRRGEIPELRTELMSTDKKTKLVAMKKVIANMTLGNDMSAIFPEVLALMQTNILELKKMVYLYVITYAKLKPELALMCVNSFIRDASDLNPLIRGLAIRTMGYIHVDKITEALTEPLRKCLKDEDPYVRKTAAINVDKLFDHEIDAVRDNGFLDRLREMLTDSTPMVVANAVVALTEICSNSDEELNLDMALVSKLLAAVNESAEWGQVYLLEALVYYVPADSQEAEMIAERIAPRLMHANSAVALAAIRLLMHVMPYFSREDVRKAYARKMSPPLVTLLYSNMPEVKYVALRNVLLLIQKRPDILQDEMKVFFCEYNDPIYVKLAKLEIMVRKATAGNVELVLSELKEYATEIDVDFVRKSVRAIGICAVKIERAADRCIDVLLELIQTKVSYVVQEAVVVIKDIFRKYPNRYERIIGTLCENLETLDEPEAKASMIWIIGQYADRIDNAHDLLEIFLESFLDEAVDVQLALLTAAVKLFLKRPNSGEGIIKRVFKWVTEEVDNPDLRDRGFIYWRLLSADPMAAKAVVLSDKPLGPDGAMDNMEPALLDELLGHIGSLAAVYHKPPSAFGLTVKKSAKDAVVAPRREQTSAPTTTAAASEKANAGADSNTDIAARTGVASPMPAARPRDNMYGSSGYEANAARAPGVSVGGGGGVMNLLDLDDEELAEITPTVARPAQAGGPAMGDSQGGLAGLDLNSAQGLASALGGISLGYGNAPASASNAADGGIGEIFASEQRVVMPKTVMLAAAQAKGLEINGTFARRSGKIYLELSFTNRAMQPVSDFAFQFNTNSFGIVPAAALQVRSPLPPNQTADTALQLATTGQATRRDPINILQIAVKNNVGIFYFQTPMPLHIFFAEDPAFERSDYPRLWSEIPAQNESSHEVGGIHFTRAEEGCRLLVNASVDALRNKLSLNNVFPVADRQIDGAPERAVLLTEIQVDASLTSAVLATKTVAMHLVPTYHEALAAILRHGQQ